MNLDDVFTYHAPTPEDVVYYAKIRLKAKEFAELIVELCPKEMDTSVAVNHIRSAVMWANASIAINGKKTVSKGDEHVCADI